MEGSETQKSICIKPEVSITENSVDNFLDDILQEALIPVSANETTINEPSISLVSNDELISPFIIEDESYQNLHFTDDEITENESPNTMSAEIVAILEDNFKEKKYVNADRRKYISLITGLSDEQILLWFKFKRQALKNQSPEKFTIAADLCHGIITNSVNSESNITTKFCSQIEDLLQKSYDSIGDYITQPRIYTCMVC